MSFLLPQTRTAIVQQVRAVQLHGDRYVDLVLEVDEAGGATGDVPKGAPLRARVGASECPADLAEGERVRVRIVMGVVMGVERE